MRRWLLLWAWCFSFLGQAWADFTMPGSTPHRRTQSKYFLKDSPVELGNAYGAYAGNVELFVTHGASMEPLYRDPENHSGTSQLFEIATGGVLGSHALVGNSTKALRYGFTDSRGMTKCAGCGGETSASVSFPDIFLWDSFRAANTFKSNTGAYFNFGTIRAFVDEQTITTNGGNFNHFDNYTSFYAHPTIPASDSTVAAVWAFRANFGGTSDGNNTQYGFDHAKGTWIGPLITLNSDVTNSNASSRFLSGLGNAPSVVVGPMRLGDTTVAVQPLEVLGNIKLDNNGATPGELRFDEPSGNNYTAFKAQAQAGDLTYTLPATDAAGALTSNGAGALTWAAAGTGDVTDVGPGCAAGACWTNGLATVGTELLRWEGNTADNANDFVVNVPLNPSALISWTVPDAVASLTFPSGTDTLVGKSTTDDLANKSIVTAGLAFKNATSGTVTLKTVTGALGTVTASLPAQTGTLAMTSDAPTRDPMLLDGALCDGTTDDLAAFQAANTALASTGGTIIVRGNKTCVLSGKTTLNSNVSIRCEAGGTLALSTKTCSGGTYPGASCTASGDCSGGGTCGGTPFAPTAATTYTLFDSLSTSESNGLLDCTINANGVDGYNTCTGGTRANLPCKNTCAAGTQAGKLCTDYTQCNFGGGSCTGGPAAQGTCAAGELCSASSGGTCFKTCTMDTVCSGAGGVCTGIPGYPSGANNTSGTVVVANFRNARKGSVISGNKTYDTRKGGMMAIGPYGYVTNNTLGLTHLTYSSNSYITNPSLAAPPLNASIVSQTDGVISTNDTAFITGNTINNMGSGVGITSLSNANLWVSGNTVTGVGAAGNYGFAGVSGGIGRIANNEFSTLEVGILTVGTDVWITNNTFATNLVSIAGGGAGMHLENNNLLFAGAINMPSGGGYTGVYSNSLIHSTIKNNFCASLFGCGVYSAGQDKRCCVAQGSCTTSPGSKQYATCTVDGDCTGASGGTNICGYTTMAHVDITGNTAYGTLGSSIGFDLSNAGVSVAKTGTNYAASIINVSNNTVQASTTGYKWPDTGTAGKNARRCKGGANLDAACAISSCAADCGAGSSCPGDCVPIFTETIFANNTVNQSTATAVTGWQPEYGLMSQNTWLNAGDLNPMMAFVTNKDAGNTVLYNAVTSDNSTTNGAVTAPASTTRTVLGVWMSESVTATKAAIATWGPTKCSVTAAAVAVGDRLCISATAGLGLTCGANSTGGYAVAMEANGAVAKNINCHINVGLPGGNYITATSVDDLSNKSIVTAGLTFKNATSGTVTINTVTGALGTVTASLPAKTGTIAVGPLMKSLTWFFPGTPATGQQAPRALVPEGVTGCTITNSRISVGTAAGSGSPAYNIARCTTSAGNCTATSNIYSGAVALTTNQSVAGGAPNTATITAGDAFKVDITNVGVTIADITVTMAYTCDQ